MSVLSDFAFRVLNVCNFMRHNYGYNLLLIIVIYVLGVYFRRRCSQCSVSMGIKKSGGG